MVNAWTWGLLAGTAVAAALTFLLALALRRRPPAVGLGVLLVPVTGLWLWAFGITAENQQTVTSRTFTAMIAVVLSRPGWRTPSPRWPRAYGYGTAAGTIEAFVRALARH